MKAGKLRKLTAAVMGTVFFFTAFPVTEMAKAEVKTDPIYYWYKPQSSDDIPKDTTFRILMIDQVQGGASFTQSNMASTKVEVKGEPEYYYFSNSYTRVNGDYELQISHLTGDVKYQIDLSSDEFFTMGDLNTPYARRLNEVAIGTEKDAKGYTGWVDSEVYKRHKSINSAGAEEVSPLIRISTKDSFGSIWDTFDYLAYNGAAHDFNYTYFSDHSAVDSRYQADFSKHYKNMGDIFEFVVNTKNPAGENSAYTQQSAYISHISNKTKSTSAFDYDEALYFSYYSQRQWDIEVPPIQSELKSKASVYIDNNNGITYVSDIPTTIKSKKWTLNSPSSYTFGSYSTWNNNPQCVGTLSFSTSDLYCEPVFRQATIRDERGFCREALTAGLLKLPKIYIGIPNRGVSEIKPNNGSTNTFTIPKDQTELIANNSYLRADRKLVVPSGTTLIVSGWLILHGELEVTGGTVIVDSGGCICYLDKDACYSNAFSRDLLVNNSTFIIMDGGKVVATRFETNNSSIINYGLFMTNWDKRVNSTYEARRYSTTYESVDRVYPSYQLANKNFIETGKDNGYPSGLTLVDGNCFAGNYKISGNTSKIIVSDMANKYRAKFDYSDSQHIKQETYYEKQ